MQQPQSNRPQKLNLDKSRKHLGADEMFYALNHDILNPNALGKSTPHPANEALCEIDQPAGENYAPNSYYSKDTNEAYSWHINDKGANYIMRVDGNGVCQLVYANDENGCLELSADPRYSIEQWRSFLEVQKLCPNRDGKYLEWTNGKDDIGYLDVEASIATKSFSTPFFKKCVQDPCDFIRLCVPKPCGCLQAELVPLNDNDISLTNHIIDRGFKFIYQHEYYDGRKSDWSDPSTLYFQDVKGCFDTGQGFPRCWKLRVPVGNPMVDKIHIAYNMGDMDTAGNNIWKRAQIVDKYKKYNNLQQKWYERDFAELDNYSDSDCSFDFYFCNDKQCEVIDPLEISRVYNPQPRKAQGLLPIRGTVGFYNYETGTCPVDKKEIDKFKVQLNCNEEKDCKVEYAEVTVRAIIHNYAHGRNQFIWRGKEGSEDDLTDTAKFGGLNPQFDGGLEEPMGYDQYFKDKTRNFIVYIEGTDYWGEMKQYHASGHFNNRKLYGIVSGLDDNKTKRKWRKDVRQGNFFYQEYTFKVPKGTRGFIRMASQHATDNEQSSSTFVVGIHKDLTQYTGESLYGNGILAPIQNRDVVDNSREEIFFDTCNGDVDNKDAFVVQDNAVDEGLANAASAYYGYIRDEAGVGIEGLQITANLGGLGELPFISQTDHNGFYHFYLSSGTNADIDIVVKGETDCNEWKEIKRTTTPSEVHTGTNVDIVITEEEKKRYLRNSLALVKIAVNDCDGQGVSGIRVALSGSKWRDTDAKGIASFKIRNYSTRARVVRAVVMDSNGCFTLDCQGNCSPCFPSVTGSTPACFVVPLPLDNVQTVTLPSVTINKDSAIENKFGLKKGGLFPFGVVAKGRCGRISSVYELSAVEIPRLQKDDRASYCDLKYDGTGALFPDWVTCVDIVRGQNLNPFVLQWLVDKIEKTDDGKLKLTIQSLNDYNEAHLFKANTIYQWNKNDRVEFVKNGDGKTFMASQHGILNYLTISPFFDKEQTDDPDKEQPADYFNQILIDDDGRLDDLKEGAKIELQREKECTTQPVYFSICVSIPVIDGRLVYPTGTFSTFDTYLVQRKIGKFAAQTFEHHAPSDFWGDYMDDRGRAYFVNKYETEKRFAKSVTLAAPNQPNYFGDLVKTFDIESEIVSMQIQDGKIILVICEYDSFATSVADDLARIGSDGILRALPADAIIGDPQPHLKGAFGCQYPDIGSILFGDGYATWVDSSRTTFVHHENYQLAINASEGKTQSYFRKRCYEVVTNNKKQGDNYYNHLRWVTGINRHTGAVCLTLKTLRDSGVNNQPAPYLQSNETLIYYPDTKDFLTFFSPTPESYSQLILHDEGGCAMLQYFKGVPYVHPINTTKWNEFFGVACDRYIGVSLINKFPEKEKVGVAIETSGEAMYYAKIVETDNPNFLSEIPPIRFTKVGRKWNAHFLGNLKSREGLWGDEMPRGYYVAVTFCRDNTDQLKYGTIDRNLQVQYDELDEFLSKFMLSEQSGFTENL